MTVTIGSICVGYGGLEMAIAQHLNVHHTWHVEFDPAASKVLAHHWPGVPNYGDVTKVDWTNVARVAVFAGGVPCQGYSHAGKRQGSDDDRDLWPVRKFEDDGVTPRRGALDAIRELMPPLVVIENVPGLLTSRAGQDFATILTDLDDLGYAVSWTTVGACKVGACHHRHRVFIAATLVETPAPLSDPIAHREGASWGPAQFVLFGDAGAVKWPAAGFTSCGTAWEMPVDTCGANEQILPTPKASDTGTPGRRASEGFRPPLSEVLLNLLPTPRTSDTNGAGQHGNGGLDLRTAVVMLPTPRSVDAHSGLQTLTGGRTSGGHGPRLGDIGQLMPTPRASDGVKGGPNQRGSSGDVMLPAAVQPQRFGKYAAAVARHEAAYGLSAPDPTEPGRNGRPRLSPEFPEWMQGLPRGHLTDVVGRPAALKLAGNGVNWLQCAYALPLLPSFRAAVQALTVGQLTAVAA